MAIDLIQYSDIASAPLELETHVIVLTADFNFSTSGDNLNATSNIADAPTNTLMGKSSTLLVPSTGSDCAFNSTGYYLVGCDFRAYVAGPYSYGFFGAILSTDDNGTTDRQIARWFSGANQNTFRGNIQAIMKVEDTANDKVNFFFNGSGSTVTMMGDSSGTESCFYAIKLRGI